MRVRQVVANLERFGIRWVTETVIGVVSSGLLVESVASAVFVFDFAVDGSMGGTAVGLPEPGR